MKNHATTLLLCLLLATVASANTSPNGDPNTSHLIPHTSPLPAAAFLTPGGTLNTFALKGQSGVLDLDGWNVTLDPERGPVFLPTPPSMPPNTWNALGMGLNGIARAIAFIGTDVYIGGGFTDVGGGTSVPGLNQIAKWNGAAWSALDMGLNGTVTALAVSGSDLYVSGFFNGVSAGGTPVAGLNRIAKWNGSAWSALDMGLNDFIYALAVSGSDVYAGGGFTDAVGTPVPGLNRIAKWNGTTWSALDMGLNNAVHAFAVSGTDLYVGGGFTNTGMGGTPVPGLNRIAKWNGSAWSALGTGLNQLVFAVAVSGSDLYAGGTFTDVGSGTPVPGLNRAAKWNGSAWSALDMGLNDWVYTIAVNGSDVYFGGQFSDVGGGTPVAGLSRVAKWNGGWSALDMGLNNTIVAAIAVKAADIYVAGNFNDVGMGGVPVAGLNDIARWGVPTPPNLPRYYVKPGGNDANIGGSWSDAFQTLRKALDDADSGDEIWVAAGTYFPDEGAGATNDDKNASFVMKQGVGIYGGFAGTETMLSQRNFTTNVTILSGDIGTVGDKADNAWHVIKNDNNGLTGTAVLDGFTITKGNAYDGLFENANTQGGGMENINSSPKVSNCIFNDNSASLAGAGMYNSAASPEISNCSFTANMVGHPLGYGSGGGMANLNSNPAINNCTFTGNGTHAIGGGMSNINCSPTITNCTFTMNTGSGGIGDSGFGGAMFNSAASPTISNCTFTQNTTLNNGGAITNSTGANPTLTKCKFAGNSSVSNVFGVNIGSGGAICNIDGGQATLINCAFSGNKASKGGAAYLLAGTFINCSFSGNAAIENGGGLFVDGSPTLTNCIIWGNKATVAGDEIHVSAGTPSVTYSIVKGGFAGTGNLNQDPLFFNQPNHISAPTTAGDLHLQACSPAKNAGTATGAPSDDFDGDTRPQGAGFDMGFDESASVCGVCPPANVVFVKHNANGSNNGQSWANAYTSLESALALVRGGTCPSVNEIWVAEGTYKPSAYPATCVGCSGDRFFTFHLIDGVKLYGGFAGTETMLSQRNPAANVTTLSGEIGAAGNTDNSHHVVLSISDGPATVLDGFTVTGGTATATNGISVESKTLDPFRGGGTYNANSNPTVSNCTFANNSANDGGAMYNGESSPTVSNCTFSGNSAGNIGGAMFNHINSSPTVSNCTFNGNSTTGAGGAMFSVLDSRPTLSNCTFSSNSAQYGGGYSSGNNSNPVVSNCTFIANSCTDYGGAIHFGDGNAATVSNCVFSGNSGGHGGGIYNTSGMTLDNCTFSGNSANAAGGAIFNFLPFNAKNCIFWNNTQGGANNVGGADIANDVIAQSYLTYSFTQANSIVSSGTGIINNQDPLFVNAADPDGADNIHRTADDGLALQSNSPALNTGDNNGVAATDITGAMRIQNTTVDMGAYEFALPCPPGNVVYVDKDATGANNGSSWANAFTGLQSALSLIRTGACTNVNEIWVAEGTYTPSAYPVSCVGCSGDRFFTFHLIDGVKLYGGFAGTETMLSQRNPAANVTTLSGEIGAAGNTDNSHHVVLSVLDGAATVLDGFTIRDGYAWVNGALNVETKPIYDYGGGMYIFESAPTLNNCTFINNSSRFYGGGMANSSSSPAVSNCTFTGNASVVGQGGGMGNLSGSNPTVTNCNFSGNSAFGGAAMINVGNSKPVVSNCTFLGNTGRAVQNSQSEPVFHDCVFSGNSGPDGGGMYSDGGIVNVTNCTFSGNDGGAMLNISSTVTVKNCIFWNNTKSGANNVAGADIEINGSNLTTVTYSLTQANSLFSSGTGIINNQDPLFVNAADLDGADNIHRTADDGLALQPTSPAVNAGNNAGVAATDITGAMRIQNTTVDMGAYENFLPCPPNAVVYVDEDATGANTGASWANAFTDLQSALALVSGGACPGVTEIWVAEGTYKPSAYPEGCTGCSSDRDFTFHLNDGIKMYGGFAGTESQLSQRNPAANLTTLSGEIGAAGAADNCYHVVISILDAAVTVLDGFTITGGNANGPAGSTEVEGASVYRRGAGGMFCFSGSPSVNNCIFASNEAEFGGGVYGRFFNGTLTGCTFIQNKALDIGGGLYVYAVGSAVVSKCTFKGNTALDGAGIVILGSVSAITNCAFSGNKATNTGGGLAILAAATTIPITNCSFSGNSAGTSGGGLHVASGPVPVTNCIFWGNSTEIGGTANVTYSIVQGGYTGTGNLNINPLFVSQPAFASAPTTSGDLHLTDCSPAKNVGTSTGAPATDFDGDARPQGSGFDMGFDENGVVCCGAPTALCSPATLMLVNVNSATLSPADVDNNSTAPCGLQSMTLSPNTFSCNHVGAPQTVTLTITDVNGATATCNTTVTVSTTININNISTTPESCPGTGNGSITISAAAVCGQISYSIDGGNSFQLGPVFQNLPAGMYNIVLKLTGLPAVITQTSSVAIPAAGSQQTWFKDIDNDGYSDGVSQMACTQPSGFKLASQLTATTGDCNDNDPLQKPGQTWYKDADNDGYSNGQTLVQCAKPANYKHASQLTATTGDCNDANAAIKPGAPELCNNLDDNCNGQVDESTSGGLTYVGNVALTSQAEVNAWNPCYTVIQGNLTIQNATIVNLNTLVNLRKIVGNVTIKLTAQLTNLAGLIQLDSIGGSVNIYSNKFQSLDGLEDLDWVGGAFRVYQNVYLTDCCAIENLIKPEPNGVIGVISIYGNKTGCETVAQIYSTCPGGPFTGNGSNNLPVLPGDEGFAESAQDAFSMTILPNPAHEQVTVQLTGESEQGSLRVFDATGRVVVFQKLEGESRIVLLDVSAWEAGIYLVQVFLDGEILTEKVFVN